VLYLLLFSSTSTALRPSTTIDPCILYSDSAVQLKQFAEDVWSPDRWRRGDPPAKTIEAWRLKLHCAPPSWQKKLKQRWRELQSAYFNRRRAELWRERVTPFCESGRCFAIPWEFVSCESGGDYYPNFGFAYGGAYGLIPPTWLAYGGGVYASQANEATPHQQDLIAHKVWLDVGEAAWRPFEGGCS
jgi:Transglycosylase-like domain